MTFPWKITGKRTRTTTEADKEKALFVKTESMSFFKEARPTFSLGSTH